MILDSRIFLKWDEAAALLGMDREGLRQALLYRWSPTRSDTDTSDDWLRVMLTLPNSQFMTSLQFDSWHREPDIQWNGRDSYYRNCAGKQTLNFSDGTSLPLRGKCDGGDWEAEHGYNCGSNQTFAVAGDKLIVSPETVVNACAEDGYISSLAIAPAGWCESGFPYDMCFAVVHCANNLYTPQPRDLFEAAVFLRSDVMRVASASMKPAITEQETKPKKLRADREENLLRVIAGLWALSELPPEHNTTADKLSALFDGWGWDKPASSTMADTILKEAANLPGAVIRS